MDMQIYVFSYAPAVKKEKNAKLLHRCSQEAKLKGTGIKKGN